MFKYMKFVYRGIDLFLFYFYVFDKIFFFGVDFILVFSKYEYFIYLKF